MKPNEVTSLAASRNRADPDRDLAGALHEVSNSLTVVLGWLERAAKDPATVRKALAVARAQAWQGYRVARRAIGAEVEEEAPGDASEVAQRAVDAVRCEADRKGVGLEIDSTCGDGPPVLEASAVAQQILLNLMLNAIAFTPAERVVRLSWRISSGRVAFRVRDEGPGIDSDRAANILNGPPSTRPGGAGIGLSHSVDLARANGGDLMLLHAGPGACFELHWPVGEARSGARHSDIAPAAVERRRILVLEDDDHVTELLKLYLASKGADVTVVETLDELGTLPRRERHASDVVLVDLSPLSGDVEGGLRLIQAMVAGAPIVLVTGRATPLAEGAEHLVAAWVRKPFDMDELVRVLADVIEP